MSAPKTSTVVRGVEFACPFCGGTASAGYADGDEKRGSPVVFHTMPVCAPYVRLDPVVYLRAVNDHREGSKPS